ncbi:hypothetical protein AUJ65_04460 [Candidatus Micrarchaeota archaeon CG1_02_51_15]|nr:MAG: hypothetical protein AUJ65_04460 [Candidatus Micrarchaeota archaeon CG1_02_51_15]
MDAVSAEGVKKTYSFSGLRQPILDGVSLTVKQGEFVGLLGPNGCGKSTFLRMLAGLEQPDGGVITVFGRTASEGRVGYVPQHTAGALFPWLDGLQNIAFGNECSEGDAIDIAEEFGIGKYAHAFPHQLSGGLKQLFAIARSVLSAPDVFLLDEPFSALDYQNRLLVEERLLALREQGATAVIVSHDIESTVLLCDRIAVLGSKPTRVRALLPIRLGERRGVETRFAPEFNSVSKQVFRALTGLAGSEVNAVA